MSEQEIQYLVDEFLLPRNKAVNILRKMDLKQALKFMLQPWSSLYWLPPNPIPYHHITDLKSNNPISRKKIQNIINICLKLIRALCLVSL